MPDPVLAFACNICHQIFTGLEAEKLAFACEKLGTPKHAFSIGTAFFARIGRNEQKKLRIVEQVVVLNPSYGHLPAYWAIIVDTGRRMNRPLTEGEVKAEIAQTQQEQ
jgi:hypothetical protein